MGDPMTTEDNEQTQPGTAAPARIRKAACGIRFDEDELQEGIDLIRSLREEGITIILVEHVMDAIRSLCDRCIVMAAGSKIAEGSPGKVLADPEVVKVYIGEDI